jgi:hypothetical protein
MTNISVYDAVGMVGTLLYFLGYWLLSCQKIKGEGTTYITMNLCGACCVLFSLLNDWNLSSAIIQIGWIILSIYGLYKLKVATIFHKTTANSLNDIEPQ